MVATTLNRRADNRRSRSGAIADCRRPEPSPVSAQKVPELVAESAAEAVAPAPAEGPAPARQGHRGGAAAKSGGGPDTPGRRGSSHSASDSGN